MRYLYFFFFFRCILCVPDFMADPLQHLLLSLEAAGAPLWPKARRSRSPVRLFDSTRASGSRNQHAVHATLVFACALIHWRALNAPNQFATWTHLTFGFNFCTYLTLMSTVSVNWTTICWLMTAVCWQTTKWSACGLGRWVALTSVRYGFN